MSYYAVFQVEIEAENNRSAEELYGLIEASINAVAEAYVIDGRLEDQDGVTL